MGAFALPPQALRMIARAFTRDMIVGELEQAGLPVPKDDKEVITEWVKHLAHLFDPSDNPFSRDSLLMGLTSGGIGFLQDNNLLSDALKRSLLLNVLNLDADSLMQSLLSRVLRETQTVANVIESSTLENLEDHINKEHVKIVFVDAYRFGVDTVARLVESLSAERDYLQFVLFTDVRRLLETCPTLPKALQNCVTLDKGIAIKDFKGAVNAAIEAARSRFPGLLREARSDSKDLVGRIIGNRLRIIEVVGRGGQATIYRADHLLMNRQCAVKVPSDEVMSDPNQAARFLREAKLASAVQHPNIVSVFDFGTDDNRATFMAMELVDGKPLDEELEERGGTLPLDEVMTYARGVAGGLAAIHSMGLVHRDLKPGNVLLHKTADRIIPKLSDFGFAIGPGVHRRAAAHHGRHRGGHHQVPLPGAGAGQARGSPGGHLLLRDDALPAPHRPGPLRRRERGPGPPQENQGAGASHPLLQPGAPHNRRGGAAPPHPCSRRTRTIGPTPPWRSSPPWTRPWGSSGSTDPRHDLPARVRLDRQDPLGESGHRAGRGSDPPRGDLPREPGRPRPRRGLPPRSDTSGLGRPGGAPS